MPGWVKRYVWWVEAVNHRVGRITMYLIFVMIGILMWSSISKVFFLPALWTLETAQFTMVAYYILGGAYSIQLGSNVRMDLVYGSWSPKTKAAAPQTPRDIFWPDEGSLSGSARASAGEERMRTPCRDTLR